MTYESPIGQPVKLASSAGPITDAALQRKIPEYARHVVSASIELILGYETSTGEITQFEWGRCEFLFKTDGENFQKKTKTWPIFNINIFVEVVLWTT